jgi:hypothetical protein
MRLETRGPEGVKARVEELKGRIESLRQGTSGPSPAPAPRAEPIDFSALIANARPMGPSSMPSPGGFEPVNPMVGPIGMNLSPVTSREKIISLAQEAAGRHGIDPRVFVSLVEQESAFNPRAVSSAGAQGLTQLMPSTARMLGVTDPFDISQSLDGGARYLSQMLKEFGGDQTLALAAYNAGPGAVRRHGGIPPFQETQNYVQKILSRSGLGGG